MPILVLLVVAALYTDTSASAVAVPTADVCHDAEAFGQLQLTESARTSALLRKSAPTVQDADTSATQCMHPYSNTINQAYLGFESLVELHLKGELTTMGDFIEVRERDGIRAWKKKTKAGYLLAFAATTDVSASVLFDTVYPYGFCNEFSEPANLEVVKVLPGRDRLVRVHHEAECTEDVAVTRVFPGEQGAITFVAQPVETPLVPVSDEITRGSAPFRGWHIRPEAERANWFAVHEIIREVVDPKYEVDVIHAKMEACLRVTKQPKQPKKKEKKKRKTKGAR